MSLLRRLGSRLGVLRASREELEASDEERRAVEQGTVLISQTVPRQRACVSGVLRAVTYRPAQDKPVFIGQLFDGTGSIDLVWIGRRSIAGVRPGVHLRAEGMVVAGRTRPTMYNPGYELLGAGQ
ncbi:MAG: OB-fold nucleic acid binding domain-containing protein [Actinomyces urogenitalis]|uniref:OB-fold nucleic acid binding domain-containing protein n=1 Tax=Actinomyces urogenitalis TaxID=103621 RepID=UPI002A8122E7|nr:OB-fold nucleic acid binding domain-containing protein [Actinomyces urogenitalis]MDY3677897.1 OB-fold nucleic acid binding domain-containing protein [Actinomyces urogenitalis]